MQKITPFLWFDEMAEEAAEFYTSIFENSSIGSVSRYGEEGPGPKGKAMVVPFTLEGQEFLGLNGGPLFTFNPAVSFVVRVETQEELDRLWDRLTDGGEEGQCGWLKDRFGLSWQIVPSFMGSLMQSGTPEQAGRVMTALQGMRKLDIAQLQAAYDSVAA